MAYQPKSYRKFLAGTVSAALVASAIGPVAASAAEETVVFPDLPSNEETAAAITELVEAGVIKGINGEFKPYQNVSRGQVAVMLARALGYDTASHEFQGTFKDLKEGEVAAAVEFLAAEGYVSTTNDNYRPLANITRQEMASLLVRTFGLEANGESKVTDLDKAWSAHRENVEILSTLGITTQTTFNPLNDVSRSQFALFLKRTLDVVGEVGEVGLDSVAAINAKTIEVKFNKAVEDTSKASVELLRGSFKQNATVTWSEDKKSVQLTGASNFQPADYTVNVSGLSEKVLTSTVKIEAQRVESIEILDEVAVVDKAVVNGQLPEGTKATVGYVVKDQYGTDITRTTSLQTNDGTTIKPNSSNGVIELSGSAVVGKRLNDLVAVVLIDTTTGKSTSKTVKLSAASTVSTIEVAGVYNAKGEVVALNDQSKASDAFIVLNLKDQYGKAITAVNQAKGLVVTNTNPNNIVVADAVSTQKIGDKDQLVIKITDIKRAGNTDILLISTTNGQSAKYTVQVSETVTTDGVTASQPEIAVADETTLIPITVTDKQGNVITDKKVLIDANKGIKVGGAAITEADLDVKDGQVYYKKKFTTSGTQALVFQTSTYKVATVTVNVRAKAVPTVVRGLKNPLVISTQQGAVTIAPQTHLLIEDQYGRVMTNSSAPVKVSLVGTSNVVEVDSTTNKVTPKANGTARLKVELATENGNVDSAVEVQVRVTDGTEYSDYEIATIGKTQAGVAKAFTVNGLLNNGKVKLQSSEFTARISGGKATGDDQEAIFAGGNITIAKDLLNTTADGKNVVDTEFTLRVTINATGKVLEEKFVVSADAPRTQEFFFTSSATTVDYSLAKAITEASVVSGGTVANLKSGDAVVNVATVDQYGNKEVKAIGTPTVTIVPDKAGEVTIEGNGTPSAKVSLRGEVTESTVTMRVTIGGATKEIKVKVVKAAE